MWRYKTQADYLKLSDLQNEDLKALKELYNILQPIKENTTGYTSEIKKYNVTKLIHNSNLSNIIKNKMQNYINNFNYGRPFNRIVSLIKKEIDSRNHPILSFMTQYAEQTKQYNNTHGKQHVSIINSKQSIHNRKWNENDTMALRLLYPTHNIETIAKAMDRSVDSIKYKIKSEKITK